MIADLQVGVGVVTDVAAEDGGRHVSAVVGGGQRVRVPGV